MRAVLMARELTAKPPVTAAGERRVRTPGGAKFYNQPIGSVIRRDRFEISALRRMARARKGLVRIPPPEPPPFSKDNPKVIRAYPNNPRLPDGRVILSEAQLADFKSSTAPHSMLAHVQNATDINGRNVKVLSKEREALHDSIVQRLVANIKPDPTGKKYLFIGGGTASGKSTVTKRMSDYPLVRELSDGEDAPANAVLLDSDAIKALLPEWGQPDKKRAAGFAHEESSLIAKLASDVAMERGLNIVLDGTGDGSSHGMKKKVAKVVAQGYPPRGLYITVPAGEAIVRSLERSVETDRYVALDVLMDIHAGVSNTAEGMHDKFERFDLFDTDVPFGAPGIPIVLNGRVIDQVRWDAFLAKKNVTHMQAAREALQRAEAKTYREITAKDGTIWSPEQVKEYTIENIQELIAALSAKTLTA